MTDLMEAAKRHITESFDTSQFVPVLLVKAHDGGLAIAPLDGDMDDDGAKDEMASFMTATIACLRAQEAALVTVAWTLPPNAVTKEEYESDDFVKPSERPDRFEVVNIMQVHPDSDRMANAEIMRGGARPRVGDWSTFQPRKDEQPIRLGGRFGEAMHKGVELGQKMFDGPIADYMDEMIAEGNLAELVFRFMRASAMVQREAGR